jgi:hypothetical protein
MRCAQFSGYQKGSLSRSAPWELLRDISDKYGSSIYLTTTNFLSFRNPIISFSVCMVPLLSKGGGDKLRKKHTNGLEIRTEAGAFKEALCLPQMSLQVPGRSVVLCLTRRELHIQQPCLLFNGKTLALDLPEVL